MFNGPQRTAQRREVSRLPRGRQGWLAIGGQEKRDSTHSHIHTRTYGRWVRNGLLQDLDLTPPTTPVSVRPRAVPRYKNIRPGGVKAKVELRWGARHMPFTLSAHTRVVAHASVTVDNNPRAFAP